MKNHPREIYRKLSLEAYKNANRFINEADLLFERKSIGHSYALAVLGFEEWVKSIIGLLLLIGYLKPEDEDVKECFENHVYKHYLGLILIQFLVFSEWFMKTKYKTKAEQLTNQLLKRKISEKRFEIEIQRIIEMDNSVEAENLKIIIRDLEKFFSDIRMIENKKQTGLYVDIDFKNNQIIKPNDLKKLRMDDVLQTYRLFIESTAQRMEELEKQNAHDKNIKAQYKEGKAIRELIDKLKERKK